MGKDTPVAADYDADGKADIAVYRNGIWYVQRSQPCFAGTAFIDANDNPVAADFDADGKTMSLSFARQTECGICSNQLLDLRESCLELVQIYLCQPITMATEEQI